MQAAGSATSNQPSSSSTSTSTTSEESSETDVVIIGSGVGGLTAGALLAKYGMRVTVCESHPYAAGGALHSWKRDGYTFESGPSLWSSLGSRPSVNPLGQVLDALDEELELLEYNDW